jgi:PAS domain S-box-containing protein
MSPAPRRFVRIPAGVRHSSGVPEPASSSVSESTLRLLVQGVQDYAIYLVDPDGHVVSWNSGAQRITGYEEKEILGRHFSVFYPARDIAAGKPHRELVAAAGQGRREDEGWRVRKDGTLFWANVVITALHDETGALVGFGEVTRDLTERRRAEQALRDSEERFRLLMNGVLDYAIFMLDPGGRVVSWNAGAERIKGYREGEILGRHVSVFYPAEDVAAGGPERDLLDAAAGGRLEAESWRVRKDSTRFWANVVITALHDDAGDLRGFAMVTRDLSERRAAEQALDERGRLLTHLVEAQEMERRRIAWDVHDDSIQSMVAVGMRLELLRSRVPDELEPTVRRLEETVRGAVGRLRSLTFRLRPPDLDQYGLVTALERHLETEWGRAYSVHSELPEEPPNETAITVFRICQEAFTNVRKHAGASTIHVSLTPDAGGILVRVSDDGVGFAGPVEATDPEHFGVIEMRERAATAGGWWSITGEPGNGAIIEFWLPAQEVTDEQ